MQNAGMGNSTDTSPTGVVTTGLTQIEASMLAAAQMNAAIGYNAFTGVNGTVMPVGPEGSAAALTGLNAMPGSVQYDEALINGPGTGVSAGAPVYSYQNGAPYNPALQSGNPYADYAPLPQNQGQPITINITGMTPANAQTVAQQMVAALKQAGIGKLT